MKLRKWLELRTRRQQSLARVKAALASAGKTDYTVIRSGRYCNTCREETYNIVQIVCKVSHAGERFYFRSPDEFAYLCRRCKTVSLYSDGSGNKTHVDTWDPTIWRGRRDADAVVPS